MTFLLVLGYLGLTVVGMIALCSLNAELIAYEKGEWELEEEGKILELPEPTFTFETSKPKAYSWR